MKRTNRNNFNYSNKKDMKEKIIYNKFKINMANKKNEELNEEEEEEEEEEIEEEEEENDYEEIKEILIKYFYKKNNILNNKILNAFRKWKKIKNYNPMVYKRNNNIISSQKKLQKIEIAKNINDNGGINKSKKLFFIYKKYQNY